MSEIRLTRSDLMKVYRRHYQLLGSYNYERQQSTAFGYAMTPALRKLYPNEEEFLVALKRHLEFFNTTCACGPFVMGIACAMEEENANDKSGEFDVASINSVKAALMGPLAGIGDSFFWGTFRVMGVGIGAPMAIAGNPAGPILYALINIIPSSIVRYQGMFLGYKGGREFLSKISADGTLNKLTESAKIIGLIVVGAMIATMVKFNTSLIIELGDTTIVLQDIINQIMPGILPLGLTFTCYYALQKGVKGGLIMILLLLFGILGTAVGFL